jgi:hypothetical protein
VIFALFVYHVVEGTAKLGFAIWGDKETTSKGGLVVGCAIAFATAYALWGVR